VVGNQDPRELPPWATRVLGATAAGACAASGGTDCGLPSFSTLSPRTRISSSSEVISNPDPFQPALPQGSHARLAGGGQQGFRHCPTDQAGDRPVHRHDLDDRGPSTIASPVASAT